MQTIEVPGVRWTQELNAFNAIHDGWLVSLDVLDPQLGAQPQFHDLPLVGITYEAEHAPAMTITAGRGFDFVTHVVPSPARLWIERSEEGADAALEIESGDGSRYLLRFRAAVLPETVDGLVR